jgi:multidrug efflux pump subunit AcrA (membrane-fusion protein)
MGKVAVHASALENELQLGRRNTFWKKAIPWIAVAVIAGGGFAYWATAGSASQAQQASVQIRWVSVHRGNVAQTVALSGTLDPAKEATLTASGKLLSVSVKAGDKVKKGQVIAQVDPSSYETQLKQAQAQLASAEARLAQSKQPAATGRAGGSQAPDPYAVAQAQASVDQAQAQVEAIQQQIAACTITSPIDGTVLQVADPNSFGSSGSGSGNGNNNAYNNNGGGSGGNTVAIIADLSASDFIVQATVDQADVANLKAGQPAVISVSSTGGPTLKGQVESIGYIPQTSSGVTVYPVTIRVDDSTASNVKLLPGESAAVTVTVKQANNVLELPTAALTQQRGLTGVFVKSDGSTAGDTSSSSSSSQRTANFALPEGLQFKPVTVGIYGGNVVEIKSGLSEGDQVAVVTYTATQQASGSAMGNSGRFNVMGGLNGLGGRNGLGGLYGPGRNGLGGLNGAGSYRWQGGQQGRSGDGGGRG